MNERTLARHYARALVQVAARHEQVELIRNQLAELKGLFDEEPTLWRYLQDPSVHTTQHLEVVNELGQQHQLHRSVVAFLELLVANQRLQWLSVMIEEFAVLANDHLGRRHALIRTAHPLTDEHVAAITQHFERVTGHSIHCTVESAPDLLAGVTVQIRDQLYDGSLKSRLNQIRATLVEAA